MKKMLLILFVIVSIMFSPIYTVMAAEEGDLEVGLVVMSTASEYWLSVRAGAEMALEEEGGNLIYTGPATDADVQGQVDQIYNLIEREIDAILLTPLDPDALVAPVEEAEKQGIPVILIDSGINYEATSFIATDNVKGGEIAAEQLVDLMGGEGKMVIVNALPGIPSNDARNEGAENIVEENSDIELLPIQRSEDQAEALTNMENILISNPDLDGIFAGFDRGAIGAAEALKIHGKAGEIPFVAYDASPEEIDYLSEGIIDALIVQQPVEMGRLGVEYLVKALNGEEVPKVTHTDVKVVTKDNMDEPEMQKVLYPLGK